MGGLDGIKKAHQHVAHAREQRRQPVEDLAATQFFGIVNHDFDAQDAAALVVNFQCQIAPFDLENGQVVAVRLHGLQHLGSFASSLCGLVRAMRKTKDRFDLLEG